MARSSSSRRRTELPFAKAEIGHDDDAGALVELAGLRSSSTGMGETLAVLGIRFTASQSLWAYFRSEFLYPVR